MNFKKLLESIKENQKVIVYENHNGEDIIIAHNGATAKSCKTYLLPEHSKSKVLLIWADENNLIINLTE